MGRGQGLRRLLLAAALAGALAASNPVSDSDCRNSATVRLVESDREPQEREREGREESALSCEPGVNPIDDVNPIGAGDVQTPDSVIVGRIEKVRRPHH